MTDTGKKPPRARTDKDDETEVLTRSARRCALCYHLKGDLSEKLGQIAHVDGDRSNKKLDNLAWACLEHHSVYDSTTSQHKNYTKEELKAARARLHEAIAAGEHHAPKTETPRAARGLATDRKTLDALTTLINSAGTMGWLRDNNFAGFSFPLERIAGLGSYASKQGAEHEFIDPELETLRKAFQAAATKFLAALAVNTFSTGNGRASVPQEWEIDNPEHFNTVVETIHDAANLACNTYDELVRQARRKLSE